MMTDVATLSFIDLETQKEALVIVRSDESNVVIGLSHQAGGDLEVVMPQSKARELFEALKLAMK